MPFRASRMEHPPEDQRWRGFPASLSRTVRCADGFARPVSQCEQLDDGRWIPKHTAAQRRSGATSA